MEVTDIEVYRDGGTIIFKIVGPPADGAYRLQTPFKGEPRPLFRDERRLNFGSVEESQVLKALQAWLEGQLTAEMSEALDELDRLKGWRNLSEKLDEAVPFHRIRAVIQCLEARAR
jgi:hypothetical protein